nr:MAG TPA: hypothetical protein [Caudoviricetes sp.]
MYLQFFVHLQILLCELSSLSFYNLKWKILNLMR